MQTVFDFAKSKKLAIDGQQRTAATNQQATKQIQQAFLRLLAERGTAGGTIDDLRRSGFKMPEMGSSNTVGAAVGALSRRGLIEAVGLAKSSRPVAHSAKLFVWKLTTRGGANV